LAAENPPLSYRTPTVYGFQK